MGILDTGIRNARNVQNYIFGTGSLHEVSKLLEQRQEGVSGKPVFFIDEFFEQKPRILKELPIENQSQVFFVPTKEEPTTEAVDSFVDTIRKRGLNATSIVSLGGGTTMDIGKAVSNLLNNDGKAEDYQGWDLLKNRGVYKIAIPTLSGTGAEATRTCVMTNKKTGLKLGMNSDYTVYDQVVLDPSLTKTVPQDQYFWTGMDAYIHCIEALKGNYRNAIGDAFSRESVSLCRQVFSSSDMKGDKERELLMVASYLGGCAIATSYVGVVHPFSAGLSVVLGLHHCVANCITMRAMEEFYPNEFSEFWRMVDRQDIHIPEGVCRNLNEEQFEALYQSTVIHEKPLTNALGPNFKKLLTRDRVKEIFLKM